MTLNQLRFLIAIADANLNITLAAGRVHATQPGLSKQLKQLEDELGFQLFTRKGKSLSAITPAGGEVIARARVVIDEVRNIKALAANLRQATQGSLKLGTTHTQARFVLPPVLAKVRSKFPDLALRLVPGSTGELTEQLKNNQLDLIVTSTSGSKPEHVIALPAYRWDRVIVVPRHHPLARLRHAVKLVDLAPYPLLTYEPVNKGNSSIANAFAHVGLKPNFALTALDADVLKANVKAGLGVGILAPMALESADLEQLVVIDAKHLFPTCITWIELNPGRVIPQYVRELISSFAPHVTKSHLDDILRGDSVHFDYGSLPNWPLPEPFSRLRAA
ncbi:CysB family transcriptional regulator [Ahniella affigens]|uniref:CysB family transcriptional regulator n=1 Tax=Ahniella affigens TaxID=2021234 RepID=A0A2P1PWI5_9GAMM|nr:LysR substrate-binding domain-containing protein [Ahniella affigens]AVP99192.1 CysB family transcriptional regulator [Ahniella affigens]